MKGRKKQQPRQREGERSCGKHGPIIIISETVVAASLFVVQVFSVIRSYITPLDDLTGVIWTPTYQKWLSNHRFFHMY